MHRYWFNPSVIAPDNGTDYYLRFIDSEFNYYVMKWVSASNLFFDMSGFTYPLNVVSRVSKLP